MSVRNFFNVEQQQSIVKAIEEAENKTSGEIRLHLESTCNGEALPRAVQMFKNLRMQKTELRNGILFYLAVNSRKFAIVGDEGINKNVPEDFWEEVKDTVLENFKQEQFCEGLTKGIHMAGEKLKVYFPVAEDDVNELSDEISFGDDK